MLDPDMHLDAGPYRLVVKRVLYYSRLRKILRRLEESPSQKLPLSAAARIACMEMTSFSRFFHRATGMTFCKFVLTWRLEMAVHLMASSDKSLTEIACESGFQSQVTFDRAFRKVYRCTPSWFRRQLLRDVGIIEQPIAIQK